MSGPLDEKQTDSRDRMAALATEGEPLGLVERLRAWRSSRLGKVVMALVAVVAVGLSGAFVVLRLRDSLGELATMDLSLRWSDALLALLCTFGCVLLGGVIWRLVLRGVGQELNGSACMRGHLLANLGGYLPGYGWKFVGKGLLTVRRGQVAAATVSAAVLSEFAALAATRVSVALWTFPLAGIGPLAWRPWPWEIAALRVGGALILLAFPWTWATALRFLCTHSPGRWRIPAPRPSRLLGACAVMCVTWLVYGTGFGLLVRWLSPAVGLAGMPVPSFSVTASFLVGLIMFFVPAGLTVREGVVLWALEAALPPGIAVVAALASRLVLMAAEVLGAIAGLTMGRSGRNQSITPRD